MKLRELMSAPAVTVQPGASVQEVSLLMSRQQISGVPVVNDAGELLGLITEMHLVARNAPLREPRYISVLSGLIPLNLEEHREYKQRLRSGLESLLEFPFVGNVRGRGLLNAIEIVKDKETREPDPARAGALADAAMARGLRTRPVANALAFAPPLLINADEVDEIVRLLGAVMDAA